MEPCAYDIRVSDSHQLGIAREAKLVLTNSFLTDSISLVLKVAAR